MEIYGTNKYKVYLRIDNICRIIAKGLHSRPAKVPECLVQQKKIDDNKKKQMI